jgi:hypothetical protein
MAGMIIGLVGSNQQGRDRVGGAMMDKLRGKALAFNPCQRNPQERVFLYEMTIDQFYLKTYGFTLMLLDADSEVEASWIRSQGGFIWHVAGNPSSVVPMVREVDIYVALEATDNHHSPMQALSECLFRIKRGEAEAAEQEAARGAQVGG